MTANRFDDEIGSDSVRGLHACVFELTRLRADYNIGSHFFSSFSLLGVPRGSYDGAGTKCPGRCNSRKTNRG